VNDLRGVAVPDAPVFAFAQPLVSPSAFLLSASFEFLSMSARSSRVIFSIGASLRKRMLLCAWTATDAAASTARAARRKVVIGDALG
jgi:hypothetical protein